MLCVAFIIGTYTCGRGWTVSGRSMWTSLTPTRVLLSLMTNFKRLQDNLWVVSVAVITVTCSVIDIATVFSTSYNFC